MMEDDAVSPVIGTILMVAVTVILAAVLYIIVGPMVNPDEEPPTDTILLQQGRVTQVDADHWDTFFTIVSVNSKTKFLWTETSFVIQADHGSLLTDATITFGDSNGDGYLTEGDSVIVNGMTREYQAGTIKVLHRGTMLGQNPIAFIAE